jgi:predicted phage terminase large subunit-like protein
MKLAAMGQHDVAAYHEFMRPDEPPAKHHLYLCDHLMALERKDLMLLCVSMNPGSAKSSYGSRSFTQFHMGRNPDDQVLAVAHGARFAEDEFSKPNRAAIDSEEYRTVFPDVFLSDSERSASMWRLEGTGGRYTVRGAGGGIAGLRADLLNIDDPIKSARDASFALTRENLFKWITADLFPRRLAGAPILLIMTRWFSDDPIGRLEELHKKNPDALPGPVKFLNIPVEALEDNDPLGRKKGEWLWPEKYTPQHYEQLRSAMSPGLWSSLYLGIPLDQTGEYIAEEKFMRYKTLPKNEPGKPDVVRKTIISVDTAQKSTERSAYTAMLVFREDVKGTHYLAHVERVQKNLEDVVTLLRRLIINWSADYVLIEDAGQGSQILENYQNKLGCPIIAFEGKGRNSKEFMFDAATPWIVAGRVLFPENATWLTEFINELVAFPDGKYKDQVDAFAQYCKHKLSIKRGGTRTLVMGA